MDNKEIVVNQNKQIVQRIRDTVARLATGRRGDFYSQQKEMFMTLPIMIVYTAYAISYLLFLLFFVYPAGFKFSDDKKAQFPGLDNSKSKSSKLNSWWGMPVLLIFLIYPFLFDFTSSYFTRFFQGMAPFVHIV
jgi:hypothetical protein